MRALKSLFALTLLSGCVATAPITQAPIKMQFQDPNRQSQITGFDTATVRTRLSENDTRAELGSVPCRLSGPGYDARFSTPAVLELPLFGNTAPQVTLSCTFDGETRSRTLSARNVSEEERREARRPALDDLREDENSRLRIVLSLRLQSSRRGFDEFRYPDTSFTFRR